MTRTNNMLRSSITDGSIAFVGVDLYVNEFDSLNVNTKGKSKYFTDNILSGTYLQKPFPAGLSVLKPKPWYSRKTRVI